MGLPRWLSSKESTCQCSIRGFHPWVGKTPWRRKCNPPQYSCLGNPMDRGAWRAIIHSVAELDTTEATEHTHTYVLQATHKATVFGSQISASTLNSYNWWWNWPLVIDNLLIDLFMKIILSLGYSCLWLRKSSLLLT